MSGRDLAQTEAEAQAIITFAEHLKTQRKIEEQARDLKNLQHGSTTLRQDVEDLRHDINKLRQDLEATHKRVG